MAQAAQLCTKCNTSKARDEYEQEEWERPGDDNGSRICSVRRLPRNVACRRRAPTSRSRSGNRVTSGSAARAIFETAASAARQGANKFAWLRLCHRPRVSEMQRPGLLEMRNSRDPHHFPGEWGINPTGSACRGKKASTGGQAADVRPRRVSPPQ